MSRWPRDPTRVPFSSMWAVTAEQARRLRQQYNEGARVIDLQASWRLSRGTVSLVIRGQHPSIRDLRLPNIARRKGPNNRDLQRR